MRSDGKRNGRAGPTALASVIGELLATGTALDPSGARGTRARRSSLDFVEVFRVFRTLGPPISNHMEPVELRGGVLALVVDEAAYLTELSFLKAKLIAELNARLRSRKIVIRDLRARLGRLPKSRTGAVAEEPKLSPAEEARVEAATEVIRDPELRAIVARAARFSLAARR